MYAPPGGPTATLEVENSTIANNGAGVDGGGIGSQDPLGSGATRPWSSTTSRSLATRRSGAEREMLRTYARRLGRGIFAAWDDSFSLHNTVVALNTVATSRALVPSDCSLGRPRPAPFVSLGHNLIGSPDSTCTGFGATDLFGGKLKLGKLADNGGPTKTIALMKGSRAIGRAEPDAVRVDQRGVKRGNKPTSAPTSGERTSSETAAFHAKRTAFRPKE